MGQPVNHKEKNIPSNPNDSAGGLSLIIFLMLASVLVAGLILFKDKIFKKNNISQSQELARGIKDDSKNAQDDLVPAIQEKPQVLEGAEEQTIQDAFDKLEAE